MHTGGVNKIRGLLAQWLPVTGQRQTQKQPTHEIRFEAKEHSSEKDAISGKAGLMNELWVTSSLGLAMKVTNYLLPGGELRSLKAFLGSLH